MDTRHVQSSKSEKIMSRIPTVVSLTGSWAARWLPEGEEAIEKSCFEGAAWSRQIIKNMITSGNKAIVG